MLGVNGFLYCSSFRRRASQHNNNAINVPYQIMFSTYISAFIWFIFIQVHAHRYWRDQQKN